MEDLCPDPLQQFLKSKENLVTYAHYKVAINDYFVNRARWAGRSRINWVGAQEDFGSSHALEAANFADRDEPGEEEIALQIIYFLEQLPQSSGVSADINALVKHKFGN